MSTQTGIWNFDGRPADEAFLRKICSISAGDSCDGGSTLTIGELGMAFRALYTTAESHREHQPLFFESRLLITWDGRLDNREELLIETGLLKNDCTDLEIVTAAFAKWGLSSFCRLTGDWALAIWDCFHRELILARDYAGSRHLFYHAKPKGVVWSTQLASIVLAGDTFKPCDAYFGGYLSLRPDAQLTPYSGVYSVPPGAFVRIHETEIRVKFYWSFDPHARTLYKTDQEYEEHFRYLFRQSVRLRLRCDSPILSDLSGGLDSSSIVCMADDIRAKECPHLAPLHTFSFCVRDEPEEEDHLYFTKVEAGRIGRGHHAEVQGIASTLPFLSGPLAPAPVISFREEVQHARADMMRNGGYKVLLSGFGGDEMLGQALDPRVQLSDLIRELRFHRLANQLTTWSLLMRTPWIHLSVDAFLMLLPVELRSTAFAGARTLPWLNKTFARRQRISARLLDAAEGPWYWPAGIRDRFHTWMVLTRQLTQTLPSDFEIRYPYLDQQLVEFLLSVPLGQLLRPGERRSLMRRSLADLLPPEILTRSTKSRAGRYFSALLEQHWVALEDVLRAPLLVEMGYLSPAPFRAALKDMKNGLLGPDSLQLVRALYSELWLRHPVVQRVFGLESSNSQPCVNGKELGQTREACALTALGSSNRKS